MASSILRRQGCWPIRTELSVRRLSSSAGSPWLMIEGEKNRFYNFYSLPYDLTKRVSKKTREEDDGALVGSSQGWLALYKWRCSQSRRLGGFDLFLTNPLSHQDDGYVELPPVETLPIPEDTLRNFREKPRKIILSSSPFPADQEEEDACRAVMSFGHAKKLAFCCPSLSNQWTPIGSLYHENEKINERLGRTRIPRGYEDFVHYSDNQLLCITKFYDFESWDLRDPQSPKLNWKKSLAQMDFNRQNYPWPVKSYVEFVARKKFCRWWKYLVYAERSNRAFVVHRFVMQHVRRADNFYVGPLAGEEYDETAPYKTVDMEAHELIMETGELRYMEGTLDGMAFFIGSCGDGFVVEKDEMVDNVEPNSIYFTDTKELTPQDYYWGSERTQDYGGHDIGIFNYEERTISPCYYPCDSHSARRIEPTPTWFTPFPTRSFYSD